MSATPTPHGMKKRRAAATPVDPRRVSRLALFACALSLIPFISIFIWKIFWWNPLLSFVPTLYFYCAPLVLILGIVSLARIIVKRDQLRGKRWAIDNIVLSVLFLCLYGPLLLSPAQPYDSINGDGPSPLSVLHAIQNAVDIFHADTACYPAHLTDLTQTDPAKVRFVTPNPSGHGGVPGTPLTAVSNYHGRYLYAIPESLLSKGNTEGTDWKYNNQTGKVSLVDSGD